MGEILRVLKTIVDTVMICIGERGSDAMLLRLADQIPPERKALLAHSNALLDTYALRAGYHLRLAQIAAADAVAADPGKGIA